MTLQKRYRGRAYVLGDNINTDVIHPPDYFSLDPTRVQAGLSKGLEEDFSRYLKEGDIIVAGKNFGCGSSRETSARALKLHGVSLILAESFARIFYRNMTNQGVVLLACPGLQGRVETGDLLEVDLEAGEVCHPEGGWRLPFRLPERYIREILECDGMKGFLERRIGRSVTGAVQEGAAS